MIKYNFGIIRDQGQQEAVMEMDRTLLAIQQMEDKWHENIAAQREHGRQKEELLAKNALAIAEVKSRQKAHK